MAEANKLQFDFDFDFDFAKLLCYSDCGIVHRQKAPTQQITEKREKHGCLSDIDILTVHLLRKRCLNDKILAFH